MHLLATMSPEKTPTAIELDLIKEVGEHMDHWVDQMCQFTDRLLQTHGFASRLPVPKG